MSQFTHGIVYTVAEGTLFVPTVYSWGQHAIGPTHRFLVAEPPQYHSHGAGTAWFRMENDEARRVFGIRPRYFDKIVPAK